MDRQIGQQITIRALREVSTHNQIIYIDDIGYRVAEDRIEVYTQTCQAPALDRVAEFIAKVRNVLPHTPYGDYGINFHFIQENPSNRLFSLLSVNDKLDEKYAIITQEFKSKIQCSNKCELNFTRHVGRSVVLFSFNYHNTVEEKSELDQLTSGYLSSLLVDSLAALKELYDLSGYDELRHQFEGLPESQGGDDDESA